VEQFRLACTNERNQALISARIGTYHNVSKKYLPLYLAEFQFRYNNRKEADIFGKAIAGC
jgi:transposase-like protein